MRRNSYVHFRWRGQKVIFLLQKGKWCNAELILKEKLDLWLLCMIIRRHFSSITHSIYEDGQIFQTMSFCLYQFVKTQILQNIPWTVLHNMRQETHPLRLQVWIYRHLSLTTNSYIREVFSAAWVKKECLLRSSNLNLHYACQSAKIGQNWLSPHHHHFTWLKYYQMSRSATFKSIGNHR